VNRPFFFHGGKTLEAHIPQSLYNLIGVLVVFNLGTICSVLYFGGKIIWWASHVEHRLVSMEKHQAEHCEEIKELRQIIISRT
jgi:sensor domain CHASE-containing protein